MLINLDAQIQNYLQHSNTRIPRQLSTHEKQSVCEIYGHVYETYTKHNRTIYKQNFVYEPYTEFQENL